MTWEEAFYKRWWPPTGATATVTLAGGEQVTGQVRRYTPPVGHRDTELWLASTLIPVGLIEAVEVVDDGPAPLARGEAAQAAAVPVVAPARA